MTTSTGCMSVNDRRTASKSTSIAPEPLSLKKMERIRSFSKEKRVNKPVLSLENTRYNYSNTWNNALPQPLPDPVYSAKRDVSKYNHSPPPAIYDQQDHDNFECKLVYQEGQPEKLWRGGRYIGTYKTWGECKQANDSVRTNRYK